jgi:chaperonin GroEL
MTKYYKKGNALNEKILKGMNTLADNVGATLGPKGRNVILYDKKQNVPVITKDGVTVAKFVELEDPFENVGVQILKQAAEQSATTAGDGTTTATVLARGILNRAQKYLAAGMSPIELKRGMDKACGRISWSLQQSARPIQSEEDILHIATISANNDKAIGTLISKAVDSAGKDGSVLVEEARSIETSLDLIEGFRFDSGYISSTFINNERNGTVNYDTPLLMITDEKIEAIEQILPTLEYAARENRPLIIVAGEMEGQALAAVIANAVRGTMKIAAVKAPMYGEERRNILKDLCASVGATFITRENGLQVKDANLTHFGQAKSVTISKLGTTIVGGKGSEEEIETRIEAIKALIQEEDNLITCERLQERITRLASGVAIIRVGAATEIEMIEKKHRIDDALEAVRSAQEEGIVPGGGVALLRAASDVEIETDNEDQAAGVSIILEAVQEPIRQMAINAGMSPDIVVDRIKRLEDVAHGMNFMTGEIVNLLECGIVDPVKVTRCALENAVSVASTIITTSHAIVSQ